MKKGKYLQIWKDLGLQGQNEHVGLWASTSMGVDKGIDANVFTSFKSYDFPKESPNILSSDYAKHVLFEPAYTTKIPALSAYKREDADRIWYDKGSGGYEDFSVWRPKALQHFYNLGDYPVNGHHKPTVNMYVFRANKDNVLTSPSDYTKKWDDTGSGADKDVLIWSPVCPDGYVATGHMAVKSHHECPARDDMKCLKCDFARRGSWRHVWDDAGSGADTDVDVYDLNFSPYSMGVKTPNKASDAAHGIRDSEIHYIKKPAENFTISDVQYGKTVFVQEQYQMQLTTFENHKSTVQTIARKIDYGFMERRRWDHDSDLEPSLNTEVEASLPLVSDGKVSTCICMIACMELIM